MKIPCLNQLVRTLAGGAERQRPAHPLHTMPDCIPAVALSPCVVDSGRGNVLILQPAPLLFLDGGKAALPVGEAGCMLVRGGRSWLEAWGVVVVVVVFAAASEVQPPLKRNTLKAHKCNRGLLQLHPSHAVGHASREHVTGGGGSQLQRGRGVVAMWQLDERN